MRGLAKHNRVLYIDPVIALTSFLTYQTGRPYLSKKMRKWRDGVKQAEENIYILPSTHTCSVWTQQAERPN